MATECPVRLARSTASMNWRLNKDSASFSLSANNLAEQDLGLLLEGQMLHETTRHNGPNRSGSAPPTIEGSAISNLICYQKPVRGSVEILSNVFGGGASEEQLRADPAYLTYYNSNVNLNPRLPPPLISRENRRLVHHIGSSDSWRVCSVDVSSKGSLKSSRPTTLSTHKEEPEDDRSPRLEYHDAANVTSMFVSGQSTSALRNRHKSIVDLIQEDFPRTPSPVFTSQPQSRSNEEVEEIADSNGHVNALLGSQNQISSSPEVNPPTIVCRPHTSTHGVNLSMAISNNDISEASLPSFSEVACSHPIVREESSSITNNFNSGVVANGVGACQTQHSIESEIENLKISTSGQKKQYAQVHPQQNHQRGLSSHVQADQSQMVARGTHHSHTVIDQIANSPMVFSSVDMQHILQTTGIVQPFYNSTTAYGAPFYPSLQTSSLFSTQYNIGNYNLNASAMPSYVTAYPPNIAIPMPLDSSTSQNFNSRPSGISTPGNISQGFDYQHLYKLYGQVGVGQFGVGIQPSYSDPFYMTYFHQPSPDAYVGVGQYDHLVTRGSNGGCMVNHNDPQKGPSPSMYANSQRPQFPRARCVSTSNMRKQDNIGPNYYGSGPNIGVLMQYPTSPLPSSVLHVPHVAGANSPGRRNDNTRLPLSSSKNSIPTGWQVPRGRDKIEDPKHSFLEELKSSKARRFELSDIAGRIVEFSADQHGSRFIQQKLENCTMEEKASVFAEVLHHASALMMDVFGNYVVQKFFEHGSQEQRKELADKLIGHILPLSLQMYGCRVIQKALEVVELEQKTQLVHELDGHVLRCVRDQNGNHVIQKCIECIPTERINFIISAFRGQVAALSTHPYGCRVIQRVLEHCTDEQQSQSIVGEILHAACILAQDQYGNYVTQHVLERGRPHERSQIINKLAGQIVQMSQHKFASNVIEKCLEHGNIEERDHLLGEIVGQTEGNDNLLIMMKDQYANYVVQKVLETCSDKQRDVLLNRMKIHLQALKKYTYGKHIVARVEQLCEEENTGSAG